MIKINIEELLKKNGKSKFLVDKENNEPKN